MAGKKAFTIAVVALAAVMVFYLANHQRHAPSAKINVADRPVAPAFSLAGLNEQKVELSSFKGKVVLVDFWATWCTPCREEIPQFVEWQKKYGDQGLQVIGISMDDGPKPVREFYQEFKLNYPVAMGDEKVAESYGGVLGLPINFLVDRDGRIQAKYTGMTDLKALEENIKKQLQAR